MAGVPGTERLRAPTSFLRLWKRCPPPAPIPPTLILFPDPLSRGRGPGNLVRGEEATLPVLQPSPASSQPPELNFGAITLNSMDATSECDFMGECWGASPLPCASLLSPSPASLQSSPTPVWSDCLW